MRSIPSALQAKLDSGITTLCLCWRITRRDGVVLGFTDHDEDVPLGALLCRAGTGLAASEITARLGLAVDGAEVSGALASDSLTEADLAAHKLNLQSSDAKTQDAARKAIQRAQAILRLGRR